MRSLLLAVVATSGAGFVEIGLALSPAPWLSWIVGGAALTWLGLTLDDGRERDQ